MQGLFNQILTGWRQCRSSPTPGPPKNAYRGPLMVIYKKMFLTLFYISRPNDLQKNILTASTILAEPGPLPGFKVWERQDTFFMGKDVCFYHMFKTNF